MKDIIEKKICIFGTGGTGKTVFTKQLWNKFKTPLAYDINGDFSKCKGGIAYVPQNVTTEFKQFLNFYKQANAKRKIDAIFFDDADAYLDYEVMNDDFFTDLVIRHRNYYKVSLIFIGKKPQNLPTKIVENSHIQIIYNVEGLNAIKRVSDIHQDIGNMLEQLKPYHYIEKVENSKPIIQKPVRL